MSMQKKIPLFVLLLEILAICVLHAFRISNPDLAPKHSRLSVSTFNGQPGKVTGSGDRNISTHLYHFIK